jgi:small subunit ribosomal protein S17
MARARKEPEEQIEGIEEAPAPEDAGPAVEAEASAQETPAADVEPAAEPEPESAEPERAPSAAEPEQPAAEEVPAPKPRARKAAPKAPPAEKKAAAKKPRAAARTPGERRPIVRLPKPERERGRQKERRGVVVSDAMDKTIVVRVETAGRHPVYKKVVRRSRKFHAHDPENQAKVGDVVRIVETRPVSKTKRWRLAEIVEAAK